MKLRENLKLKMAHSAKLFCFRTKISHEKNLEIKIRHFEVNFEAQKTQMVIGVLSVQQ